MARIALPSVSFFGLRELIDFMPFSSCFKAKCLSNGVFEMSPQSTTVAQSRKGFTLFSILMTVRVFILIAYLDDQTCLHPNPGDILLAPCRAAFGPNLAPGLYVTPRSNGWPTIATSNVPSFSGSKQSTAGRCANVPPALDIKSSSSKVRHSNVGFNPTGCSSSETPFS